MNKQLWIYDLECFANFFSGAFINTETLERKFFYVHEDVNQLGELVAFLDTVSGLVGFNNVSYDYPMIHFILTNQAKFKGKTADFITKQLKDKSNKIIESKFSSIREAEVIIKQLDLMKMKHFDVFSARHQSLKGLEFIMRMDNIQDLPYPHDAYITKEQVAEISLYNFNDVEATLEFYIKCAVDIGLRRDMTKEYKVYLMNSSEPTLATEIFLHFLSIDMDLPKEEIREMRTKRDKIELKDCIPKYVKFATKEFNAVLEYFKSKVITETKGALTDLPVKELGDLVNYVAKTEWEFDDKTTDWKKIQLIKKGKLSKLNVDYKGLTYYLGTGGIHASRRTGVFRSDDIYEIIDIDVQSFYPRMAIVNGYKPAHLGDTFGKRYEWLFDQRVSIPKTNILNLVFKLILNALYGKSKDANSYLLDSLMTMQICVTGQLSLLMLVESLSLAIPDIEFIQANTDGITVKVKRTDRSKVNEMTSEWEKITKLKLEYAYYDAMQIVNVNNYIAEYLWEESNEEAAIKVSKKSDYITKQENGKWYIKKLKLKGLFEIDKDWHKDHSQKIVPIALRDFFVKGIPIEDTISNCTDIYDFCKMLKGTKGTVFEKQVYDGEKIIGVPQQKTTRYYVSNKGHKLLKVMPGIDKLTHTEKFKLTHPNQSDIFDYDIDDCKEIQERESIVDGGNYLTIMNKLVKHNNFTSYDVNIEYYMEECRKITKLFKIKSNETTNSSSNILTLF